MAVGILLPFRGVWEYCRRDHHYPPWRPLPGISHSIHFQLVARTTVLRMFECFRVMPDSYPSNGGIHEQLSDSRL